MPQGADERLAALGPPPPSRDTRRAWRLPSTARAHCSRAAEAAMLCAHTAELRVCGCGGRAQSACMGEPSRHLRRASDPPALLAVCRLAAPDGQGAGAQCRARRVQCGSGRLLLRRSPAAQHPRRHLPRRRVSGRGARCNAVRASKTWLRDGGALLLRRCAPIAAAALPSPPPHPGGRRRISISGLSLPLTARSTAGRLKEDAAALARRARRASSSPSLPLPHSTLAASATSPSAPLFAATSPTPSRPRPRPLRLSEHHLRLTLSRLALFPPRLPPPFAPHSLHPLPGPAALDAALPHRTASLHLLRASPLPAPPP